MTYTIILPPLTISRIFNKLKSQIYRFP